MAMVVFLSIQRSDNTSLVRNLRSAISGAGYELREVRQLHEFDVTPNSVSVVDNLELATQLANKSDQPVIMVDPDAASVPPEEFPFSLCANEADVMSELVRLEEEML